MRFVTAVFGGMIWTWKGMKNFTRAFVSLRSRLYSWAIFSAVHVCGWFWWLLRAFSASTRVTLPLGTSVSSTRPSCSPGRLYFRGRRSASGPPNACLDVCSRKQRKCLNTSILYRRVSHSHSMCSSCLYYSIITKQITSFIAAFLPLWLNMGRQWKKMSNE